MHRALETLTALPVLLTAIAVAVQVLVPATVDTRALEAEARWSVPLHLPVLLLHRPLHRLHSLPHAATVFVKAALAPP